LREFYKVGSHYQILFVIFMKLVAIINILCEFCKYDFFVKLIVISEDFAEIL